MEFVDRKSTYPNRYTMTDENGNVSQVFLERADEPVAEGTPLDAETFNALLLCEESKVYPGCYYHTVDGEDEWLNPPMIENKAHRTTKRFNGYPVYTAAVVFPTLGAAGHSVMRDITGVTIARVLNVSTVFYPKDPDLQIYSGFFMDHGGMYAKVDLRVNDMIQQISITSLDEFAAEYSAVCTIEFTKAEEAL